MNKIAEVSSKLRSSYSVWSAMTALTLLTAQTAQAAAVSCTVSKADYAKNATLSFDDFDQKGSTPTTWRALSQRGCNEEAAAAAEDYLAHAKLSSVSAAQDVVFHIAQTLALAGHNDQAAILVVAAKDPVQSVNAELDWNTYLNGTWGYLRHRRDELERAHRLLVAEPGIGNQLNAKVIGGLLQCFDKPYSIAYSSSCRVP